MGRDLLLIAFSLMTWGIGEGLFFYFQPLYLEQLGADPLLIGAILGGYGVATTVAHIPAGILADRWGRRPVMLAAWLVGTLAAWVMALANSLPVFVGGMLLYGTTIFVAAPLNSYVSAASGRWSVGRTLTLMSASLNLGAVVGPWLGGRIGDQLGLRQTYVIAAGLFVLSTLIFLPIRPQPVEPRAHQESPRTLLTNRPFGIFLMVAFAAMYAMYLPQPLAPNYLQNQQGLSLERIGGLYALAGIGIVTLNLIFGQLKVRWGYLLSLAAVGGFTALLWRGAALPWYALAFFLLGGYRAARSLAMAFVRDMVPPAMMGLAYGMTETVVAAATILAPPLAGALYVQEPTRVFPISLVLIALAWLASAAVMRTARDPAGPAAVDGVVEVGWDMDAPSGPGAGGG